MIDNIKKAKDEVKGWGFAEWGSFASIVGIGLWIYDNSLRKHLKFLK